MKPGGRDGSPLQRKGGGLESNGLSYVKDIRFAAAAARALACELSIIMLAADRLAAGHSLEWSDHDRLHAAHQHVLAVLANITGREVLQ